MKNLFTVVLIILFQVSCLQGQELQRQYEAFGRAIQHCGTCIEDHKVSAIDVLLTDLNAIEKAINGNGTEMERRLLMIKIVEQYLKAEAMVYDSEGGSNLPKLNLYIDKLFLLKRNIGDANELVRYFATSKWSGSQLAVLGMRSSDQNEVMAVLWQYLNGSLTKFIQEYEDMVYLDITSSKNAAAYEYFVDMAYYPRSKAANHNSFEAYITLYKLLTFSGDEEDLKGFKQFVDTRKANTEPWQSFLQNPEFRSIYDRDLKNASRSKIILGKEVISSADVDNVLQASGEKEVALVAIQRYAKPNIAQLDFTGALKKYQQYASHFSASDEAHPFVQKKYAATVEILKNAVQGAAFGAVPVDGASKSDINEIRFFFNKNGQRMAIEPTINGAVWIANKTNDSIFQVKTQKPITFPGGNIYWFEQKDISRIQVLNEISKNQYFNNNNAMMGSECFDFNMNERVILFVSYSDQFRMNKPEQKEDIVFDYWSPGFINKDIGFQEEKRPVGYHGRKSGNPNTDIYYMVLGDDNVWSQPQLLRGINTPFCERSPILSVDGQYIYFASEGWAGLGGLDVFKATISIDYRTKQLSINNADAIEHISGVNSAFDDLYYLPLSDTGTEGPAYISSNREDGQDFDIYYLDTLPQSYKLIDPPIDPPVDPEPDTVSAKPSDNPFIRYTAHCHWNQTEANIRRGAHHKIRVTGRILDPNGKPYPYGAIFFQEKNATDMIQYDTVELQDNGHYTVYLEADKKYFVRVYGYLQSHKPIEGFVDDAIAICPYIPQVSNIVEKDYKLIDVEDILKNGYDLTLPLFFEYNQSTYSVSNLARVALQLEDVQNRFYKHPGAYILMTGYTDMRGNPEYNVKLARRRINFGLSLLKSNQINRVKIESQAYGRTNKFDSEASEFVGNIHAWYDIQYPLGLSKEEQKYLMNRRVQFTIKGIPEKNIR